MLIISLVSQKGGSGKTTLALNLAVAAEKAGQTTLVIDLDPQGSASAWAAGRQAESPVVTAIQAHALEATLRTAREHAAALVLIDTAPHAEQAALAAARASELVLIPCRPSLLDLHAIRASHDITALAKTPATVVLNAVPPRGMLADEAEAALAGQGVGTAPVRIGQRADFVHAITASVGVLEYRIGGKAATEISRLHAWLLKQGTVMTTRPHHTMPAC